MTGTGTDDAARAAAELGYQADGGATRDELLVAASHALLGVVGGDQVMFNAVRLDVPQVQVRMFPATGDEATRLGTALAGVLGEHPMAPSYLGEQPGGLPAPRRMSDVADRTDLHRNRAYVDVLRPAGWAAQLTIVASPVNPTSTRGWAIARSTGDFPDDALARATALQPLLSVLDRTLPLAVPAPPTAEEAAALIGLTDRELQVLQLIGEGLTAHRIGTRLRISGRTAEKHRENVYRKLAVRDRLRAVQRAQQLGILPRP